MNSNATTTKTGLKKFGFIPQMDYKLSELSALRNVVSEDKGTNNNRKHKIFTSFFASSIYTPL